jgi:hypothetical protein
MFQMLAVEASSNASKLQQQLAEITRRFNEAPSAGSTGSSCAIAGCQDDLLTNFDPFDYLVSPV